MSTRDTNFACATGQIFYTIWWESLTADKKALKVLQLQSTESSLKGKHLLRKFHRSAYFPWQDNGFKTVYLKRSTVQFGTTF